MLLRYTDDCQNAAQGRWPASGVMHGEGIDEKRRDRPKSIRVFENGFIEKVFARAHPITPILWFGPFIAYGLYDGVRGVGLLRSVGYFALGWLIWTLMEYLLHRFLFHMSAHTPEQKFRSFMVHGYHHEFPNDKLRLVAPPLMSFPIAVPTLLAFHWIFGDLKWLVFAGTAAGYVAYDWIHYYTHHFRPGNPIGKWLKSYHLLHHFDDYHGRKRYGVSSPLWDFVFGTYRPVKKRG
jgi:sterol desaturase/sphingolipid hydroxylase (fatty acid hydroxylase superfamily)